MATGCCTCVLGVGTVWAVWRLGQSWGLPPGGSSVGRRAGDDRSDLAQSIGATHDRDAGHVPGRVALLAVTRAANEVSIRRAGCSPARCWACACSAGRRFWCGLLASSLIVFASAGQRPATGWHALRAGCRGGRRARAVGDSQSAIVFGRPDHHHDARRLHACCWATIRSSMNFCDRRTWGSVWDAEDFNRDWAGSTIGLQPDRPIGRIDEVAARPARPIDRPGKTSATSRHVRLRLPGARRSAVGRVAASDEPGRVDRAPRTALCGGDLATRSSCRWRSSARGSCAENCSRRPGFGACCWWSRSPRCTPSIGPTMRMRAPLVIVVALLAAYGGVVLATKRQDATSSARPRLKRTPRRPTCLDRCGRIALIIPPAHESLKNFRHFILRFVGATHFGALVADSVPGMPLC